MKNPDFLDKKYPDLTGSKSVESAVKKIKREGGKAPYERDERIETYLKRLEDLILDPENVQNKKDLGDILHTNRPRALALLREKIINEYITPNKEKMAEGAAIVEERAARQMGIDVQYGAEQLEQRGEIAVGDLVSSLDQWITYLSDKNEPYPVWFRYYAFRNILNLGEYDKDKQEFPKRSKGTFKLFPEVDRGALAYIEEMIEASQDDTVLNRIRKSQEALWGAPEKDLLTKEKAEVFANMPFANQYAEGIKQNGDISPELRAETRGEWIKYQKGTDATALWLSLQNKGTAWCTKGYPTAKTQLNGGDFYVYYTLDAQGNPTIPRIAIRMEGDKKIAENPRGVFDTQQNLEPNMVEILEEKLKDFGSEADKFKKKSEDMKLLTTIENKVKKVEQLTKEDLVFLYEINSTIEGFGYRKDPRIEKILLPRGEFEDIPIVFGCEPDQVAHMPSEINKNTKAYVGPLEPGVLQKLPENFEHVYTSFPDKKIRRENVEIGGKDAKQLIKELETAGINISNYAKDMLQSRDFTAGKKKEEITLIRLTVADLGFSGGATTDQVYARVKELGLELCPADTGPNYRLKYLNQPLNEWVLVGMKQIADRDGYPFVFRLARDEDGMWLNSRWAGPGDEWDSGNGFVFRLRPSVKLGTSKSEA